MQILIIISLLCFLPAILYMFTGTKEVSESKLPKDLLKFLEQADEAYMRTHETVDIAYFSKFATMRVCDEIIDDIHKKPPKMFGTRKYRKRSWTILEQNNSRIVVRKEVTHQHIEVGKGVRITLGDDMVERWYVVSYPSGFLVEEVLY